MKKLVLLIVLFVCLSALSFESAHAQSVTLEVSGKANLYYATIEFPDDYGGGIAAVPVPLPIAARQQIAITATGCVIDAGIYCTEPDGSPDPMPYTYRGLLVYSLIGRWSTNPTTLDDTTVASAPLYVGNGGTLTAPSSPGTYYLFLADNDGNFTDNPEELHYDVTATVLPLVVDLDIKPGSYPNCLNNDGHGVIPVAILTTGNFDATTVDPFTVTLDGAAARMKGKSSNAGSLEDVDGDGDLDLVLQITDVDGNYVEGDTFATLSGMTFDGVHITGTDSLCLVP
jgi:hypothetical protein